MQFRKLSGVQLASFGVFISAVSPVRTIRSGVQCFGSTRATSFLKASLFKWSLIAILPPAFVATVVEVVVIRSPHLPQ
jgi:hypothetical protein